jgi:transcription-repair coupling factor (superfamily II helicase)
MKFLLSALEGWAEFRDLEEGLRRSASDWRVTGLEGAARAFILAGLYQRLARPLVVLAPDAPQAAALCDDLAAFLSDEDKRPPGDLLLYPSLETLRYEDMPPDRDVLRERMQVLWRLAGGERLLLVTTPEAAFCRTLPRSALLENSLEIGKGGSLAREELQRFLGRAGYEREELVEMPGQYSLRGEVVDIWPSTASEAVRIEQFGDEVESLRRFEPETQRSLGELEALTILPARELLLEAARDKAGEAIAQALEAQATALEAAEGEEAALRLRAKVSEDLDAISQGVFRRGLEYYLPYLWDEATTLADYLADDALVVWEEPESAAEYYQKFLGEVAGMSERRTKGGLLLNLPQGHFLDWEQGRGALGARAQVEFSLLGGEGKKEVFLEAGPAEDFAAKMDLMTNGLQEAQKQNFLVAAVSRQARRLQELLLEADLPRVHDGYALPAERGDIVVTQASLSRGFKLRAPGLVVFTDKELFGWKRPPRAGPRHRESVTITALSQLKGGDYVVHIHHGIGIYDGLVRQTLEGAEREYLLIRYAEEDKLYVPADQFDRVQKYIGVGAEPPALNRLGGKEWERTRKKARASAKEMAKELVALYSARSREQGHGYSPDTPWQQEMEAGFPYEETPDQNEVLREIKADMEKPVPMDRLVCGDVGFGKTEVAVRAAFKALMEGKQVAVLVPTTVLAAQHYNTFRERFAPYPVKVEMLSRFRSAKEQARIIAELAVGGMDLVVGTHRLLSKDVVFKDLGLLVVDEEQRFGVRHKERIKQLRTNVDVITLTATPIPRTLHMAMSGLREMSLINDPPEGRRPVHTQASPRSDALIAEAVMRELERGGQVYYVHNRVESIPHAVAHLQRIVPKARIVAAHGQMTEGRLEKVMVDFYQGKYDILVCTTIIENGLDLPNVNTLIADEADKLGLAQLYQLRGRVGRSERQAYAYLMWTPHKRMSETAQQRIHAIREFSDLGSGLKLALRDLEIRGAGNLLGAEQHGFAAAVGFDLYCQLLAEAVKEERGQPPAPRPEVSLDLPVEAFLPEDWVPSLNQRIELYRRLAAVGSEGALEDLAVEMRDRFGAAFPPPVYNLYRLIRIKLLGMAGRVERISVRQRVMVFQLAEPRLGVLQMRDLRAALALQKDLPKGLQVEPTRILLPLGAGGEGDLCLLVEETLGVLGRLWEKAKTLNHQGTKTQS